MELFGSDLPPYWIFHGGILFLNPLSRGTRIFVSVDFPLNKYIEPHINLLGQIRRWIMHPGPARLDQIKIDAPWGPRDSAFVDGYGRFRCLDRYMNCMFLAEYAFWCLRYSRCMFLDFPWSICRREWRGCIMLHPHVRQVWHRDLYRKDRGPCSWTTSKWCTVKRDKPRENP